MMMPQPTEQYGQVLRVSVVRGELEVTDLSQGRGRREAERRQAGSPDPGRADLEELASGELDVHQDLPPKSLRTCCQGVKRLQEE